MRGARRLQTCSLLVALLAPRGARADATDDMIERIATDPTIRARVESEDDKNLLGSPIGTRWRRGVERWFWATRLDAGFLFFRTRISAGYGRPHYDWFGLDAVPIVFLSAAGGYLGVRYQMPGLELRTGALYQYSFNRSFLRIQESYDKRDIDVLGSERAQYVTWDSELEANFALGPAAFITETQAIYAGRFLDDHYVYMDTLGAVIARGWTFRERVGVQWIIPRTTFSVAPAVEVLWLDERREAVLRAGVMLRWVLSEEVQIRTNVLPAFVSPDRLGRANGDVLEITLRWLWASD